MYKSFFNIADKKMPTGETKENSDVRSPKEALDEQVKQGRVNIFFFSSFLFFQHNLFLFTLFAQVFLPYPGGGGGGGEGGQPPIRSLQKSAIHR